MFTTETVRAVAVSLTAAVVVQLGAAPADGRSQGRALTCRGSAVECAARLEGTLVSLRDRLGCDHHAPFAAEYTWVQRTLRETLRERPGFFAEPSWVARDLNAAFVSSYLRAYEADRAGRPAPDAWRIAFDAARTGRTNAGQDALLGANAHIQRDMPYVLAALGFVRADGASRKGDFDRFQTVLDRAYGPSVRDIARRYDPLLALADDRWNPVAHFTAHELFVLWRQNAWHYARRLAAADGAGEFRAASRAVEANAAAWATLLASVQVPGYGLVRDAYCRDGRTGPVGVAPPAWTPLPLPVPLRSGRLPDGG
ncbi:DUF5995 family protein [Streptomyces sp. NPDC046261]|uniref:DUF5995 family protein n=1 Tax=Streptomyces sp. NPDC046261 TaxID=3157200 RepID=UPI0033E85BB1